MIEKYGEGTLFEEVCATCGYRDDELKSSGVHETSGGSLQFYSEDQQFSCPYCPVEGELSSFNIRTLR